MLMTLSEQVEHWGQSLQKFRINNNKIAELLAGSFQTALRQQSAAFAANQLLDDSVNDTLEDEERGQHGTVFILADQARDGGLEYRYGKVVFEPVSDAAPALDGEELTPDFVARSHEAVKALFGDAVYLSFAYTPWVMILNRLFTLGFEEGTVKLDLETQTLSVVTVANDYRVELDINRREIEAYLDPELIQATLEGRAAGTDTAAE